MIVNDNDLKFRLQVDGEWKDLDFGADKKKILSYSFEVVPSATVTTTDNPITELKYFNRDLELVEVFRQDGNYVSVFRGYKQVG